MDHSTQAALTRLRHAIRQWRHHWHRSQGRQTAAVAVWLRKIFELTRSLRRRRVAMPRALRMACMAIALNSYAVISGQTFESPVTNPWGTGSLLGTTQILFEDIDNDGDLDHIGRHLPYACQFDLGMECQINTGNANAPAFPGNPEDNPFGFLPGTANDYDAVEIYNGIGFDLVDIDGDGDLDAFMNADFMYGYAYDPYAYGFYQAPMLWIENTGTPESPAFGSFEINPFNLNLDFIEDGFVEWQVFDFADLDNDGDFDLIGTSEEELDMYYREFFYCENVGTASSPDFAPPVIAPFNLNYPALPWGHSSTVQLVDLDLDDDLDLIHMMYMVPQDSVILPRLVYYKNLGSPSSPLFSTGVENPFGLVDGLVYTNPGFFTCQFVDLNDDGDADALFNDADASFYFGDEDVLPYQLQENTELAYISGKLAPSLWRVHPNPIQGATLTVSSAISSGFDYVVHDVQGRRVLEGRSAQGTFQLDTQSLSNGLYNLTCASDGEHATIRVVVER